MSTASPSLQRFAWLSVAAAAVNIVLKAGAFWLTGSVGLLSDALETMVNLVAALLTLSLLGIAARPADEGHAYGHSKAEYFASAAEGALIIVAAVGIAWAAVTRLLQPQPIERIGLGVVVTLAATALNLVVARILLGAGRRYASIALEADGHHLMADVWTSVGVVGGLALVRLTGWQRLDPIIALLVAANIVRTGVSLMGRSAQGLLDAAWSDEDRATLLRVLDQHRGPQVQFHALRTRQAGARRFVSMHVLVPGEWTVARGHQLLERIEGDLRAALPHTTIDTHIEPLEDPASWADTELDRD